MKKNKQYLEKYLDRRLFTRIRLLLLLSAVLLVAGVYEILKITYILPYAVIGLILGYLVGIVVSRMFHLSWDEETNQVISNMDWIGAIVFLFYIIFIIARTLYVGQWVQGAPYFAIILTTTAGVMMGRVMGTRHGIKKILGDLESLKKMVSQ